MACIATKNNELIIIKALYSYIWSVHTIQISTEPFFKQKKKKTNDFWINPYLPYLCVLIMCKYEKFKFFETNIISRVKIEAYLDTFLN